MRAEKIGKSPDPAPVGERKVIDSDRSSVQKLSIELAFPEHSLKLLITPRLNSPVSTNRALLPHTATIPLSYEAKNLPCSPGGLRIWFPFLFPHKVPAAERRSMGRSLPRGQLRMGSGSASRRPGYHPATCSRGSGLRRGNSHRSRTCPGRNSTRTCQSGSGSGRTRRLDCPSRGSLAANSGTW